MKKEIWDKILQAYIKPYYQVIHTLNKEYMTVSEITELLKISKRQLFHWDQKGLKISAKTTGDRAWRRFSILDLFGFSVVRKCRTFGLGLDECEKVIDWLRHNLNDTPDFIYNFSQGLPIFAFLDIKPKDVKCFYGYDVKEFYSDTILKTQEPVVIIPLSPLLRLILRSVAKPGFSVDFVKDGHGENNRVTYTIYKERYEFKLKELLDSGIVNLDMLAVGENVGEDK
jgi:DNA-binding transcriptional MerR regulator